jgi:hypothetical protein
MVTRYPLLFLLGLVALLCSLIPTLVAEQPLAATLNGRFGMVKNRS